MNWMGCVMGRRLVSQSKNSFDPFNQMPKVWKEGIGSMDGIMELPKQNRALLLSTLLPLGSD